MGFVLISAMKLNHPSGKSSSYGVLKLSALFIFI